MKKLLVLMLCLVLLLLPACGSKDSGEKAPEQGKDTPAPEKETPPAETKEKHDIVLAQAVDFISMDPHDTNDTLSYSGQKTMLEGLFGFDKDMKVTNLLAESYTANDEATVFEFKLREGISFSDGTPFNAEAVKVNLDRLADQTQGLKRNTLFNMVDKTEVIDEYNVRVTLKEPFGAFINTLAHPAGMMLSPKALEEHGKEVARHPVGTGQYIFKEWNPGEKMVVEANPNYWGGEVGFKSITFVPVPESGTRVAMLQSGEADFIFPVPSELMEGLSNKEDITVFNISSMVVRYVTMNVDKKPFDDIRVRHALNYAVDKEAYMNVVYNGFANPMDSLISPSVQFHASQPVYEYNVEKAKELLAEAGYPDGFTATLWAGNTTIAIKQAQFLQQQLGAVGVTLNVENMETGILNDKVFGYPEGTPGKDAEIEMYAIGWSPSTGDADWGLRPLAATESFPPKSFNAAYYSNPDFDAAIYDALNSADPAVREEAYARAQKIVWADAPMIWLAVDDTTFAAGKRVEGIYILPDGSLSVYEGVSK